MAGVDGGVLVNGEDEMNDLFKTMGLFALLAVVIFIPTCTYKSCFSDEAVAERKATREKEAAQYRADQEPRVIREAGGCKVYAFKEGSHWHYFTKCPTTTTTDRTYESCRQSGKTRTCENKTEQIVTENGK